MSKVLIDRELLCTALKADASIGATAHELVAGWSAMEKLRGALLDTPSGTPAMPVKAYYHEATNEYGGFNKSVGLEVRKEFIDAPLVLESDALTRIAYLEGEIAKRDARIVELDAVGVANEKLTQRIKELKSEIAAIKAQEPVEYQQWSRYENWDRVDKAVFELGLLSSTPERFRALYAAPVSEAKAQGVVMPEPMKRGDEGGSGEYGAAMIRGYNACLREVARLNAAHVQQVSVPDWWRELLRDIEQFFEGAGVSPGPDIELRMAAMLAAAPAAPAADAGLVEALETAVDYLNANYLSSISSGSTLHRKMRAALAAHRAKGVV